MHRFIQSMIWSLPDSRRLDRYLQRHYTGCEHPEFVLRGSFHSPLPDLKEVRANGAALFSKEVDPGPHNRWHAIQLSATNLLFIMSPGCQYGDW
jgi:hypothetical protein